MCHCPQGLFLVLVTNKQSNILEDLETLKLLARILNEYEMDEDAVSDNCFEIVFAFDEAIAFGHREHINMQQIKTNLGMESHEEKLHKMIIQSKINDTKDIMKKKAMEIDKSKLEKKMEGRGSISSFEAGMSSNSGIGSGMGMGSSATSAGLAPEPVSYAKPPPRSGKSKGMKLGKKKASLLDTFKDDTPTFDLAEEADAPTAPINLSPVTISIEEKIVCTLQNDGGLENMDVQGNMTLEVNDEGSSCIRVMTEMGDNPGLQFKTHPNIDKALFNSNSTLGLKDPNRPFPTGSALGVLKWRFSCKDESKVPLQISCWPSVSGSDTYVNLEYEAAADFELQNVQILIPVPGPPTVNSCDGDYQFDGKHSCLVWMNELIDDANREGSMEFVLSNTDPDSIYPIEVSFTSNNLFCNLDVKAVVTCAEESPVKYDLTSQLSTEEYQVVI